MSVASKFKQLRVALKDRRWWPFYFQRQFLGRGSRGRMAHFASRWRPRDAARSLPSADVDTPLAQLGTRGLAPLGRLLDPQHCTDLVQYFLGQPVKDPYRTEHGAFLPDSPDRHPHSHVAHHTAEQILKAPGLLALANDPRILDIAARFLGCKPTVAYLAAWWSYPTAIGAQQAEHFHRDVDDWRFLKLFVYLTDVGPENGPHIYVTHSSSSDKLRSTRRFSDAEVVHAFGTDNVQTLTGQAGEAFLEDTFGFHKGQPVNQGRRLMFSAVYSMYPLPYGPRRPQADMAALRSMVDVPLDPWINRCYIRSA